MKVILNLNVEDLEVLNHIYNMIDEEKYKISRMKHRKSNTKEDLDAFEKKLYECCAAGLLIDKIYWNAFNKLELLEEKKERKGRSNYRPCKDRDPYKAWTKQKKTTLLGMEMDSPENGLPYASKTILSKTDILESLEEEEINNAKLLKVYNTGLRINGKNYVFEKMHDHMGRTVIASKNSSEDSYDVFLLDGKKIGIATEL